MKGKKKQLSIVKVVTKWTNLTKNQEALTIWKSHIVQKVMTFTIY